jgi:DNA-binding NarL/FixJ family response regulator
MVRILLVDDHDVVRRGVRTLLVEQPNWVVCGEAVTGRAAVDLAGELRPDVAIVDLLMPDLNGLDTTRQIRKTSPRTEVLIFTMHQNEELVRDVLDAGARGYVLKSDAEKYIVTAIEALLQHRPYFTPKVSETLINEFLRGNWPGAQAETSRPRLTGREREVIQLLAEGNTNKEIALTLGISVKTVETHRAALMRKIGVNSIAEVVRYAVRNHLTEA